MRSLHIGKLLVAFSLLLACGKIDYNTKTQWCFTNRTENKIEIVSGDNSDRKELNIILTPGETKTINIEIPTTKKDLVVSEQLSPYSRTGATIKWQEHTLHLAGIDEGQNIKELQGICNALYYECSKTDKNTYRFLFIIDELHLSQYLELDE